MTERAAASDDPTVLARLVRRAEEHRARRAASGGADAATSVATATREPDDPRDAVDPRAMLQSTGVMTIVATQFLVSTSISSYFIYGAGSLELADQPGWVADTYDPYAGVDPGAGGGDYGAAATTAAASTGPASAAASTGPASAAEGSTAAAAAWLTGRPR